MRDEEYRMFKNAVVKRVESVQGHEVFVAVFVVWEDADGRFRAVVAGGEAEQGHDDHFNERVFDSQVAAFEWVDDFASV
jgi:hypothetical protein